MNEETGQKIVRLLSEMRELQKEDLAYRRKVLDESFALQKRAMGYQKIGIGSVFLIVLAGIGWALLGFFREIPKQGSWQSPISSPTHAKIHPSRRSQDPILICLLGHGLAIEPNRVLDGNTKGNGRSGFWQKGNPGQEKARNFEKTKKSMVVAVGAWLIGPRSFE